MTKSHFFFISWSSSINQLPVSSSCSFLAKTRCEILLVPGLRITSWGDINGKNSHISCLANSISSGTARILTNPLRNTTKTLLAPQRKADVAQSKAVSPALVGPHFWSTILHRQPNVDIYQKNGPPKNFFHWHIAVTWASEGLKIAQNLIFNVYATQPNYLLSTILRGELWQK